MLDHLRENEHLVVSDRNGIHTLTVVPQVFYLDVVTGIDALEQRWFAEDLATRASLERAFDRWLAAASDPGKLSPKALRFLGVSHGFGDA